MDKLGKSSDRPLANCANLRMKLSYRDDKTAAEADTIQTLRALLRTPAGGKVSPAPAEPDWGRDVPLP